MTSRLVHLTTVAILASCYASLPATSRESGSECLTSHGKCYAVHVDRQLTRDAAAEECNTRHQGGGLATIRNAETHKHLVNLVFQKNATSRGAEYWIGAQLSFMSRWTWVNGTEDMDIDLQGHYMMVFREETNLVRLLNITLHQVQQPTGTQALCRRTGCSPLAAAECYFHENATRWFDARNLCKRKKADLAVSFPIEILKIRRSYFIGLRRVKLMWNIVSEDPGLVEQEAMYTYWGNSALRSTDEQCVVLHYDGVTHSNWNVARCDTSKGFICEYQGDAPHSTKSSTVQTSSKHLSTTTGTTKTSSTTTDTRTTNMSTSSVATTKTSSARISTDLPTTTTTHISNAPHSTTSSTMRTSSKVLSTTTARTKPSRSTTGTTTTKMSTSSVTTTKTSPTYLPTATTTHISSLSWLPNKVEHSTDSPPRDMDSLLIVAISVSALLLVFVIIVLCVVVRRKSSETHPNFPKQPQHGQTDTTAAGISGHGDSRYSAVVQPSRGQFLDRPVDPLARAVAVEPQYAQVVRPLRNKQVKKEDDENAENMISPLMTDHVKENQNSHHASVIAGTASGDRSRDSNELTYASITQSKYPQDNVQSDLPVVYASFDNSSPP